MIEARWYCLFNIECVVIVCIFVVRKHVLQVMLRQLGYLSLKVEQMYKKDLNQMDGCHYMRQH